MKNNKLFRYVADSYQELLKVTWPTRVGLAKDTAIVIVSSAIVTAILSLIDLGLSSALQYFVSLRG